MYTNVKVNILDSQKEKLKKALASGSELSLHLSHENLVGNDIIALTQSQLNILKKAYETGKGITIKMSKTQVGHNMKVGGFLSLLASIASKVLPALGIGAMSGLATTGVQKLVGNGLFIKKGGCVCEIDTDGKRVGWAIYLREEGKVYHGRGLLLGPNSPFENIPIIGMLL